MDSYDTFEKYAEYEAYEEETERHHRRPQSSKRKKKSSAAEVRASLTDLSDDIADFVPTYAAMLDPRHHERQWVIDSVAPFYRDNLITDVTRRVKAGKEANVYCCTAHPAVGLPLLAAKLYRPRMLRTLKNDADYKAGRQLRGEDGKEMRGRREKLAIRQKTSFGKHLDMVWWIGNEVGVQRRLYEAGADVPQVVGHSGNTILMEYIGDDDLPAPTLSDVRLDRSEVRPLFDRVIDNIRLMLEMGLVHGDLSAYNILYWQGSIRIIDFPQVAETAKNPNAQRFLERDVSRICAYFGRLGVAVDAATISRDLWQTIVGEEPSLR
jgi:RIO kinase 1